MPGRHSKTSDLRPIQAKPCGQNRDRFDVVGQVNDLINCYIITILEAIKAVLPQVLIAVVLLAVMILAAYMFLRG